MSGPAGGLGPHAPRTLWVTNDLPPRAGGIEQFVANLLARCDPGRTRVLASSGPGDRAHDAGLPYPVERVGRRPLLPTRALARRVETAAEAMDADVVVLGALWPLGHLASRLSRPVAALTHGHEAGMVRIGLGPLVRRAAARVRAVGYISNFTRGALAQIVGEAALLHLPPGVDVAHFHPTVDGAGVRARHGIAAGTPLTLCLSRLVRRKGQDRLVEAWPAVRARVPGAHLLIGGDGPLAGELSRRVDALGLQGAVTFAGEVAWSALPHYHAAADLFAMPCRTRMGGLDVEGLGIVYLEAQASGVPVLAGRSGGAPETIENGRSGIVIDGRSASSVAETVADLLADPQRRASMGRAGRELAVMRHSWDAVAGKLDALVEVARRPAL